MNDFCRNRRLTDREQKFRNNKLCICCGAKMDVAVITKKIDGKYQKIGERWDYECKACKKSRCQLSHPTDERGFGATRASVQHEFIRRIGGNFRDGN